MPALRFRAHFDKAPATAPPAFPIRKKFSRPRSRLNLKFTHGICVGSNAMCVFRVFEVFVVAFSSSQKIAP
jgi:hypothetical protein